MPVPFRPILPCLVLLAVLVLAQALAGAAAAGPWPRAVKDLFLSYSCERDGRGSGYCGLYAEYGLRPNLMLGVEIGRSSAGEANGMLWLQRPLDRGDGPNRLAAGLGVGALRRDGRYLPQVQLALGLGRNFDSLPFLRAMPGGGWLSVEARYRVAGAARDDLELAELAAQGAGLLRYLTPESQAKGEITLGWHAAERLILVGQFRLEKRQDTGAGTALAITVVRDLPGPLSIEMGLVEPLSGPGARAVKLGSWIAF